MQFFEIKVEMLPQIVIADMTVPYNMKKYFYDFQYSYADEFQNSFHCINSLQESTYSDMEKFNSSTEEVIVENGTNEEMNVNEHTISETKLSRFLYTLKDEKNRTNLFNCKHRQKNLF